MAFISWLNDVLYDGLPYGLTVMSFLITFRYLNFPDLTAAGSFVFGAAISAISVVDFGVDPYIAVLLGGAAGAAAGCATAIFHAALRIERLLAGILCAFLLYGVNQLLLSPTLPYGTHRTILSLAEIQDRQITLANLAWHPRSILIFLALALLAKALLDWYLRSEAGLALRALEDADAGEEVLRRNGLSPDMYRSVGLIMANTLVGMSGAVTSMREGAANAHRGFDVLVTGLVAYLVGVQLSVLARKLDKAVRGGGLPTLRWLSRMEPTSAAILGALVYFGLIDMSQRVQVRPELTRIVLVLLVVVSVGDFAFVRRLFSSNGGREAPIGSRAAGVPLLELRDIHYQYPTADEESVRGVSMTILESERLRLEGANGTGKTTLFKIAAGLLTPTSGEIRLSGQDVTADGVSRLRSIVYVDQNPHRGVVDTLTVEENLALAQAGSRPSLWRRALDRKKSKKLAQIIDKGGFPVSHLYKKAGTLSGGQRQVTNLLSLLARNSVPKVVLLDEPTNNLDAEHTARCREIIDALRECGVAVILVSHAGLEDLQIDRAVRLPSLENTEHTEDNMMTEATAGERSERRSG